MDQGRSDRTKQLRLLGVERGEKGQESGEKLTQQQESGEEGEGVGPRIKLTE